MIPLRNHRGVAAPLLRINIDTDAIIPSREMKRISKKGLGEGLFAGWRYRYQGQKKAGLNAGFILNQPEYQDASILLAGANFGCGSSREHAVWALMEFGIRVVIAPSFGSIFRNNCVRNGLLPVVLPVEQVERLAAQVAENPGKNQLSVDLETCQVTAPDGTVLDFDVDRSARKTLMEGLDPITVTFKFEQSIDAFKTKDRTLRPWAYLPEPDSDSTNRG